MKLLLFFMRNPDEELSIQDAEAKFNVSYTTAQRAFNRLVTNGWLLRRQLGNAALYAVNPKMLKLLEPE
jgi:transposase